MYSGFGLHRGTGLQAARAAADAKLYRRAAGGCGLAPVQPSVYAGRRYSGQWWLLFHSPALDMLVRCRRSGMRPDLQAAQAALRTAMENVKAQMGSYYPAAGASLGASRNQNAAQLSPALTSAALLYNLYQGQLSILWSPDLWAATGGRWKPCRRRRIPSASSCNRPMSGSPPISSPPPSSWPLRAQIDAIRTIIAGQQRTLEIEQRQQVLGQIAGGDVAAQQVLLAGPADPAAAGKAAGADPRPVDRAGRPFACRCRTARFDLAALKSPQDVPVSLPSKLVEQRADVRAAEENLHMAARRNRRFHCRPAAQHHFVGRSGHSGDPAGPNSPRPATSFGASARTLPNLCSTAIPSPIGPRQRTTPMTRWRRNIAAPW